MIDHEPRFDTERVCSVYQIGTGVPIKYVCTSASGDEARSMDIFYRHTPHPKTGNRYFGLFRAIRKEGLHIKNNLMTTNADKIEKQEFGLIEDDAGNLQYSSHRHDYKMFENGNMIDGGRAYIKSNGCPVHIYVVRDGEMVSERSTYIGARDE
jgi:hypothetical protein